MGATAWIVVAIIVVTALRGDSSGARSYAPETSTPPSAPRPPPHRR